MNECLGLCLLSFSFAVVIVVHSYSTFCDNEICDTMNSVDVAEKHNSALTGQTGPSYNFACLEEGMDIRLWSKVYLHSSWI